MNVNDNEKKKKKSEIDTVPEITMNGTDGSSFFLQNYPVEDLCAIAEIPQVNGGTSVGSD